MISPGVWPREAPRATPSESEARVYDALRRLLPRGWYAWHSLRLRAPGNREAEADFVIADPARGILLLEVKGGQVEERDGRWFTNGQVLRDAPLDQGQRLRKILLERLSEKLRRNSTDLPYVALALLLPDTAFERPPGNDDLAGRALGAQDLAYLDQTLPAEMGRLVEFPQDVPDDALRAIHDLWGERWVPEMRLGRRRGLDEDARLRLDEEQVRQLDAVEDNATLLVEGGPGTGKTLLARAAAQRMAASGLRTLLLCFTEPLAKWLAESCTGPNLEVRAIKQLALELVRRAGLDPGDPARAEYWKELPLLAAGEALAKLGERWDAVVVDEGQDLGTEDWLLIDELRARAGKCWAFWDPSQAFWPDRAVPEGMFQANYRLTRSYRTPPAILALANEFIGGPRQEGLVRAAMESGVIGIRECPSATSVRDKVAVELDKLQGEGFAPQEIAVISLRGATSEDSIVRVDALGRHRVVRADSPEMDTNVVVETFLRFKGLERPAIVLTDLRLAADKADFGRRMFIGMTRALGTVRVVDAGMPDALDRLMCGAR